MTSAPAPFDATAGRFDDRFGIAALVEALSSPFEGSASGSAAAVAGALAAAVVGRIARAANDPGAAAQADALVVRLTSLASEDADAYDAAMQALADPGDGSEADDFQLGAVLRRAADVPLQIAEAAADVALLATQVAESAPLDQNGDAVGAARIAEGAARATAHLVEINLASRPGDERHVRARRAVADAAAQLSGG